MGLRSRRRGKGLDRRIFRALVGLILLVGAIRLYGPLATNHRQQDELARLRLEKAALATERDRLIAQKRLLASEAGLEAAARMKDYVRDGERRIKFIPAGEEERRLPMPGAQRSLRAPRSR